MAQDPTKQSVVESTEEKLEEFKFWVQWDDIEPTKYRCRLTTVDDKTFETVKHGIKLRKSNDGTFETHDKLPLAIQKLIQSKTIILPFAEKIGNVEVEPRSIIVEQSPDIPNLVMCAIEGIRKNGNSGFGGVWYHFGSNKDLANGDKKPMIQSEKINVMAKSTTHLPTLAQKIDYCGRFGYEEMMVQEIRDSILQAVESGSTEELCKLYNVVTSQKVQDNPEEALRELLKNVI